MCLVFALLFGSGFAGLGHNGQRCRFRSRPEQEGPDAKGNPTERLRHELSRASVARDVDTSARSCRSLQHARLLVELAKLLERGKFDALFLADVLGVYDVHRGSPDAAIANAAQVPVNDPLLLIPAMAYVTRNLGFGVTCAVSYEHPYTLARRLSTLDHLTGGRIGWNVSQRGISRLRFAVLSACA
jgi:hypothetical protein